MKVLSYIINLFKREPRIIPRVFLVTDSKNILYYIADTEEEAIAYISKNGLKNCKVEIYNNYW